MIILQMTFMSYLLLGVLHIMRVQSRVRHAARGPNRRDRSAFQPLRWIAMGWADDGHDDRQETS